jgi:hypothetical protein
MTETASKSFSMLQLLDESQDAGGTTIRLRVYVPGGEPDNDLPYLYSIETGGGLSNWTMSPWAHQDRWLDRARLAFDEAIQSSLSDYRRSHQAKDDVNLRDASHG